MAIQRVSGETPLYIGEKTDRESMNPLPAVGAEFFESDTGLTYVFCGTTDGSTAVWALKLYPTEKPSE
jgi:hypothetical protein